MIKSMTGFGRGVAADDNFSLTAEIKSVNHRFLEIYTRLPRQLVLYEDAVKKQLQGWFKRGKMDVFVTLERNGAKNSVVKVDKELAMAYYNALCDISAVCGVENTCTARDISSMNGVLSLEAAEDDIEELTALLYAAVDQAAQNMTAMRLHEGESLTADLSAHLAVVEGFVGEIAVFAPQVVKEQKTRLEQRLADILGDVEIDQARLANELAFYADKVDINEELARLGSHIGQFRASFAAEEPIGRKMEFILQEMLRETNTIGSKSNALEISNRVISVKSELEKLREQIQNVE